MRVNAEPEIRFWLNVRSSRDGCWQWRGGVRGHMGYGAIRVGTRKIATHRYSWSLHFGDIPDGLAVLHSCDNPKCVRPDHLFLGTDMDNARDRDTKGRRTPLRGAEHGRSVVTEEQATALMADYLAAPVIGNRKQFGTRRRLAEKYGITEANVQNIVYGRTWNHATKKEMP